MSYAIIRNANYKMKNLAGIYRHNERKNTNYSNEDINKNNSKENYSLKSPPTTYEKLFRILKEKYDIKGQIKTVSNIACEYIITSDKEYFESIGKEETKRFFKTAYSFASQYKDLGEKYILSAKVHMDETTPHMHLVFLPVIKTKDKNKNLINKLACSMFWKGKNSYRDLQDKFYNYMTSKNFNLERGQPSESKHISIEELKTITNYEQIKQEIDSNRLKELKTDSLELAVTQNKKLINYCYKLEKHYILSSNILNNINTYKKEFHSLKKENIKLKKQNTFLKENLNKLNSQFNSIIKNITKYFNISREKLINIMNNCINK